MTLPADARIGQISLTVRDLDRSVAFYRDVLGFEETAAGAVVTLAPPGGRTLIELHENTNAVPKPRRSSGLFHFAILVPSRAALGRSLRRLAEKQWPISGAADHLVSEALYLNDADGLGIEIYRDQPRDKWRVTPGGELAMATDPLDLQSVYEEPGAEAPWNGLEAATVMGHVHLHVPHLDSAEAFYCGRIGFEPMVRGYPGALFVAAGGYHHHVGLNTWVGVGAPPPPENAVGMRRFTIESAGVRSEDIVDEATRVTVSLIATG
jgi:catechol 2,3-dioxygenase